jgi:hypothetical protein
MVRSHPKRYADSSDKNEGLGETELFSKRKRSAGESCKAPNIDVEVVAHAFTLMSNMSEAQYLQLGQHVPGPAIPRAPGDTVLRLTA